MEYNLPQKYREFVKNVLEIPMKLSLNRIVNNGSGNSRSHSLRTEVMLFISDIHPELSKSTASISGNFEKFQSIPM